jgi:hypothetical protein
MHRPRLVAVELHEDEVPDLDVAVAVGIGRAGRAAGDVGTMVEEDLGARAARTGVAHLPEVVAFVLAGARLVADADAAIRRHADVLRPELEGLRRRSHRPWSRASPSAGRSEPVRSSHAKRIGVALEVLAEAEVAEHLEERVVARGVAHVLEVVVLAAGAHAALRGHGRGIGTASRRR